CLAAPATPPPKSTAAATAAPARAAPTLQPTLRRRFVRDRMLLLPFRVVPRENSRTLRCVKGCPRSGTEAAHPRASSLALGTGCHAGVPKPPQMADGHFPAGRAAATCDGPTDERRCR